MATKRWSHFVEYVMNKNLYELAHASFVWWSLMIGFESPQIALAGEISTFTRAYKSRNALAIIRFPVHITR